MRTYSKNRGHDTIKDPPRIASSICNGIHRSLSDWYAKHHRDLPWRRKFDPYHIWISEVMLQQTQVKTMLPYYQRFTVRFPSVFHLARADLQTILKHWEGLGYYSRARHLHKAAGIITAEYDGRFPDSWDVVRQLPGIGDYIAAAVLSIAFGQPYAVVDGNVKRVLARLFLFAWPVNQARSHVFFQDIADQLLDRTHPGNHNQAMMELGALICTPRKPDCSGCPVSQHCQALKSHQVLSYPKRIKRAAVPLRHISVGVVHKKGRLLLIQRAAQGLLGGFWEFPGGMVDGHIDPARVCEDRIKTSVNLDVAVQEYITTVRHTYTHFKLRMDVYQCCWIAGRVYLRGPADFKWVHPSKIFDFPLHGAMHKAIKAVAGLK